MKLLLILVCLIPAVMAENMFDDVNIHICNESILRGPGYNRNTYTKLSIYMDTPPLFKKFRDAKMVVYHVYRGNSYEEEYFGYKLTIKDYRHIYDTYTIDVKESKAGPINVEILSPSGRHLLKTFYLMNAQPESLDINEKIKYCILGIFVIAVVYIFYALAGVIALNSTGAF